MFPEMLSHLVAPENNRNLISSTQPLQQVQESPVRKGSSVSEVIERLVPEVVWNTPNEPKVCFINNRPMFPVGRHIAR